MNDELFKNLEATLVSALQKSEKTDDKGADESGLDEVRKAVTGLAEQVEAIAKALAPGREAKDDDKGEEPGTIAKAIKDLTEDHKNTREALEKMLERVEALEKGGVVRKSAAGTDESGKDDTKDEAKEEELRKEKGAQDINAALVHLAKNPGKSVTLV